MRTAKSRFAMLVLAATAGGIGHSAQENKTQPGASQQASQDAWPQQETKFLLVQTSVGVTKGGAVVGEDVRDIERSEGLFVYRTFLNVTDFKGIRRA